MLFYRPDPYAASLVHESSPEHVLNVSERQFPDEHPKRKLEIVDLPTPVAPITTNLGLGNSDMELSRKGLSGILSNGNFPFGKW